MARKKLNLEIMKRAMEDDGGVVWQESEGYALAPNFKGDGYKSVRVAPGSSMASAKFQARGPKVDGEQPSLGTFATPREAAVAYAMEIGATVAAHPGLAASSPPPPPPPLADPAVVGAGAVELPGPPEAECRMVIATPSTPPLPHPPPTSPSTAPNSNPNFAVISGELVAGAGAAAAAAAGAPMAAVDPHSARLERQIKEAQIAHQAAIAEADRVAAFERRARSDAEAEAGGLRMNLESLRRTLGERELELQGSQERQAQEQEGLTRKHSERIHQLEARIDYGHREWARQLQKREEELARVQMEGRRLCGDLERVKGELNIKAEEGRTSEARSRQLVLQLEGELEAAVTRHTEAERVSDERRQAEVGAANVAAFKFNNASVTVTPCSLQPAPCAPCTLHPAPYTLQLLHPSSPNPSPNPSPSPTTPQPQPQPQPGAQGANSRGRAACHQ